MQSKVLTYNKLDGYLRDLSKKHKLINTFSGFTQLEFVEKFTSKNGLEYPALVCGPYTASLSATNQRTFNNRSISFSIIIKCKKDSSEIIKAQGMAEMIGLEFFARIKEDSLKCKHLEWLYNNFDASSVDYSEIEYDGQNKDGVTGMEFSFSLKNRQPLIVNKGSWSDLTRYAFTSGFSKGFR